MAADSKTKTTIATLNRYKRDDRTIVAVSAYDYPQSILCNKAGIDVILVGDSLGMTTYGLPNTLPVEMSEMLRHSQAVYRGNSNCFLMGDYPFLSYQKSDSDAIENAGKFLQVGADAVKLEGCFPERIQAVSKAGMLVFGHIGLTPMTRAKLGGYRVQGKTKKDADVLLEQAKKIEDAGAFGLLLEAVPSETAQYIKDNVGFHVWGIGAGPNLHGQLVIFHDLVGLFFEFKSKFVKRYVEGGLAIQNGLEEYAREVRGQEFPSSDHCYTINPEELEKLLADDKWKYEKLTECENSSNG